MIAMLNVMSNVMLKKNFSFIEAPIYQGQKHFGVSLGPAFIRQMLLDQNYHFDLFSVLSNQSNAIIHEDIYEELSYIVEREARRKKMIFVTGGDHSLSIGSVQGLLRCEPDLKVIWIDAHGDINTESTSLTQSFHGMPLSFLLGLDQRFAYKNWFDERLKPENLIYFGLRDLDLAEKKFLDQLHIKHYTAEQINGQDLDLILKQIRQEVQGHSVHISMDADGFDPSIAPATGVRVEKGLRFEDVKKLVENILDVAAVKSFEYVELNPQIFQTPADVFKTAQIGIDIFKLIHQKNKLQEVRYGFDDRFGDSEKSGLHDPNFELEKQG